MVESAWDMALATLYSIRKAMDICNEALYAGDFLKWYKGLLLFHMELSQFLSAEDNAELLVMLDDLKGRLNSPNLLDNIHEFRKVTMKLRYHAHRQKMLIKEAEDTSKHGG